MTAPALTRSDWLAPAEPQPPGVYPGVPFEEYFAWSNVSVHQLHSLARSPAHYVAALAEPRKQTAGMTTGQAVHTAVLEPPDQFALRYAPSPEVDKRTTAGKQAHQAAAAGGRTLLKMEELLAIRAIVDAIRAHPFASILLAREDGESEISLSWIDAETGVFCKARPDFVNAAHNLIIDLKTTQDASMGAFARACVNYRYHVQASFYLASANAVGLNADAFVFVAVETASPWACACYELSPDDLQLGRTLYRKDLRVYKGCLESGTWPSYPEHVRILELPAWSRFIPVS